MNPLTEALWVEKYRPTSLDQMALPSDNREFLEECLEKGEIPHLLLLGPAGCGKTTLSYILRDKLDCQPIVLNASKERGIDVIRDKVSSFSKGVFGKQLNLVIMDEADSLTRDAQNALRNLMETYAERTRFILTGNQPHRIIDPIRSRCQELELARLEVKDRFKVLVSILNAEDIQYEPEDALAYAERFTDLRRLINAAQKSVLSHGELVPPSEAGASGKKVLELIFEKNWDGIVEISKTPGVDHGLLLQEMFWAVDSEHPDTAGIRYDIGRAVHDMGYTPDPVVLFLATCSGLMEEYV